MGSNPEIKEQIVNYFMEKSPDVPAIIPLIHEKRSFVKIYRFFINKINQNDLDLIRITCKQLINNIMKINRDSPEGYIHV
jgi:hypothetical protein